MDRWRRSGGDLFLQGKGRPSIPPAVYFRMLLVGYFKGLDTDLVMTKPFGTIIAKSPLATRGRSVFKNCPQNRRGRGEWPGPLQSFTAPPLIPEKAKPIPMLPTSAIHQKTTNQQSVLFPFCQRTNIRPPQISSPKGYPPLRLRYQRMVSRRLSSKVWAGRQPSSRSILKGSMA